MAKSSAAATLISLDDVRDSVKRVQSEGERFVSRIRGEGERVAGTVRRQTESLVDRIRKETKRLSDTSLVSSLNDLRDQAERLLADLQKRGEALRSDLTDTLQSRATTLATQITRSLGAADADRVKTLSREVTGLELRVAELERKLTDVLSAQQREKASKKKDKERDAAA